MKKYRVNAPIRSVKGAIKKKKAADAHQMEISEAVAVVNYVQEQVIKYVECFVMYSFLNRTSIL